jgi:hypothetical protein
MVMDASVRALRRRRRRYALSAHRRRVLPGLAFPRVTGLPGGRRLERQVYLFWRVRLPLWVVLAAAGWLVLGWAGVVPGLAAAILAELAFSFRWPCRGRPVSAPRPGPGGPGGSAGVREPRRPRPAGGGGAAQLPVDPAPPGMG